METLFIYLLKASALIAAYFLAYHFLLRKETFFTTNRWFLLAGMITSVTMPLLFIKKIIMVEKPKVDLNEMMVYANQTAAGTNVQEVTSIDWFQISLIGYEIISVVLFVKILTHLFSLFKLLHKKEVIKKEQFSLVDLNEDIAPFSFFNYIVYNSSYYTNDELHSILLHEKVHSQEKHSFDVLLSKFFCIIFWFNPFMWLYKKAIIQNLEYIADQKAIQHIEDKKVYQKALLKVVTHQNCLSITSHFYQSLIKKRIVMLNKNQSKKSNSWKYALVLPVLVGFFFFFQIKVIAQERAARENSRKSHSVDVIQITKNTSDNELKENKEKLKSNYNVSAKFSKVRRNNKGELTSIKIDVKTPQGLENTYHFSGDNPIKPFSIIVNKNEDGIVNVDFGSGSDFNSKFFRNGNRHSNDDENEFAFSFSNDDEIADIEAPEPPEAPELMEAPEASEAMEAPEAPDAPELPRREDRHVIIKQNGDKKEVWVNGEKVTEDKLGEFEMPDIDINMDIKGPKGPKGPKNMKRIVIDRDFEINTDENDGEVVIVTKGRNGTHTERIQKSEIRRKAMQDAKEEVERAKPEIERARREMERARPEMERARREIELSKPEMEKARQEMMKAKIEMEKAKEEMLKAKDEMIKAKVKSKTQKA